MFSIATAYAIVLLILSSFTTAVLEVLQRLMPIRYWFLRRELAALLQRMADTTKTTVDASKEAEKFVRLPSTNPMDTRIDRVEKTETRSWLTGKAKIPNEDLGNEDLWWKQLEDQMTRRYRRFLFVPSFALGLGLSWGTGLEAFSVGKHLASSPAEVEALLDDQKTGRQLTGARASDKSVFFRMVDREILAMTSKEKLPERLRCIDKLIAEQTAPSSYHSTLSEAAALVLAAGSTEECSEVKEAVEEAFQARADTGFSGYPLTRNLWLRWLGRILMALLISLGAPFWFDLVKRLRQSLSTAPTKSAPNAS